MSDDQRDWLTVTEAAAQIGVSEKTLRKRINAGTIEAQKITLPAGGVAWRVAHSALAGNVGPVPRLEAVGSARRTEKEVLEALPVGSASHREEIRLEREGSAKEAHLSVPAGEFEALKNEVAQLRGALVGGALKAIDQRLQKLDSLPDADMVRGVVNEAVGQAIAQAVKESDGATREDVEALTKMVHELAAQIEALNTSNTPEQNQPRQKQRSWFARLTGKQEP